MKSKTITIFFPCYPAPQQNCGASSVGEYNRVTTYMQGKAASCHMLLKMIREIKISSTKTLSKTQLTNLQLNSKCQKNLTITTFFKNLLKLLQNDPETDISFRNLYVFHSNVTKTQAPFLSEVHFKPMTNQELSNALAHDAKLFLSFITQRKCWEPIHQDH